MTSFCCACLDCCNDAKDDAIEKPIILPTEPIASTGDEKPSVLSQAGLKLLGKCKGHCLPNSPNSMSRVVLFQLGELLSGATLALGNHLKQRPSNKIEIILVVFNDENNEEQKRKLVSQWNDDSEFRSESGASFSCSGYLENSEFKNFIKTLSLDLASNNPPMAILLAVYKDEADVCFIKEIGTIPDLKLFSQRSDQLERLSNVVHIAANQFKVNIEREIFGLLGVLRKKFQYPCEKSTSYSCSVYRLVVEIILAPPYLFSENFPNKNGLADFQSRGVKITRETNIYVSKYIEVKDFPDKIAKQFLSACEYRCKVYGVVVTELNEDHIDPKQSLASIFNSSPKFNVTILAMLE